MLARLMGLDSVSPAQVHRLIDANGAVIIDVNSPESWRTGHVPGARNLEPAAFTDADLPSDRHTHLVFYCSNFLCRKAPNAARRAKQMGYDRVSVMSAGLHGWVGADLPTQAG